VVAPAPTGFERSSVIGASIEDLDTEALATYLRQRAPALVETIGVNELALRIGLLAKISGGLIAPTIAGLVAFGLYPQLFRPEWGLSVIRVRALSISDAIVDREDLEGGLVSLLEQGLAFVAKHSQSVPELLHPGQSRAEFPEVAIREALVNGLVHRDLRLPGRVGVRIFDDRLEISSPGGLPAPLPLDELAQRGGLSLPRNPLLAAVGRGLGIVEQVGSGLPRIRASVAESTTAPIHFQSSHHEVMVTIPSALRPPATARVGN
jgi:ATP-dependent DNA helicase RecG